MVICGGGIFSLKYFLVLILRLCTDFEPPMYAETGGVVGGWWVGGKLVCKTILVFYFGPNQAYGLGLRLQQSRTISDLIFWYFNMLFWNGFGVSNGLNFWLSVWQQIFRPWYFFLIFLDLNSSTIFMLLVWHWWPSSLRCYGFDFISIYFYPKCQKALCHWNVNDVYI